MRRNPSEPSEPEPHPTPVDSTPGMNSVARSSSDPPRCPCTPAENRSVNTEGPLTGTCPERSSSAWLLVGLLCPIPRKRHCSPEGRQPRLLCPSDSHPAAHGTRRIGTITLPRARLVSGTYVSLVLTSRRDFCAADTCRRIQTRIRGDPGLPRARWRQPMVEGGTLTPTPTDSLIRGFYVLCWTRPEH